LSLDDLLALNDEVAALSRAGVPLEVGLRHLGSDMPGRLGRLANEISDRLERGESIATALEASGFPPAYRAIVEAGVRTNRLSAAIEGVAMTARRAEQLRQMIVSSLIYPCTVVVLAYCLTLFGIASSIESDVFRQLGTSPTMPVHWLTSLRATMPFWAPWPPVIGVGLLLYWYWRSGNVRLATAGTSRLSTGRYIALSRLAGFTDLLCLMITHDTPLDEAIELAGRASGNRALSATCERLAAQLRRGEAIRGDEARREFPPLLAWLLLSGTPRDQMVRAVRRLSDAYRLRAQRMAAVLAIYVPLLLTAVLGGSATLAYAVVVLGPWYHLLHRIGYAPLYG
jgi:general secretion pathway protein F